jgi:hypothetical protein
MPMLIYMPPPLTPATLSTSLLSSLSSSLPFVSLLKSYILSISPFISLSTISQTLLLALPFLYITPLPSPSSPLPRLFRLPSPPHIATTSPIAPAYPLVMAARYNHRL